MPREYSTERASPPRARVLRRARRLYSRRADAVFIAMPGKCCRVGLSAIRLSLVRHYRTSERAEGIDVLLMFLRFSPAFRHETPSRRLGLDSWKLTLSAMARDAKEETRSCDKSVVGKDNVSSILFLFSVLARNLLRLSVTTPQEV